MLQLMIPTIVGFTEKSLTPHQKYRSLLHNFSLGDSISFLPCSMTRIENKAKAENTFPKMIILFWNTKKWLPIFLAPSFFFCKVITDHNVMKEADFVVKKTISYNLIKKLN